MICQLTRTFCLGSRESVGSRKLSLPSAVAAGFLTVAAGGMVPASGESRDTMSPDPAVASSDPLFQSVCIVIPAPSQAIGIWICGPYKFWKSRQYIRLWQWRPGAGLFRQLHYRRGLSAGLCSIQQRCAHWRRSWLCGSIRPLFSLLRQGGPIKSGRAFSGVMGRAFFSTRRPHPVRCDPDFTRFRVWIECDIKSDRSGSVAPPRPDCG